MKKEDSLEYKRRMMRGIINAIGASREVLEEAFGPEDVWDTEGLAQNFDVEGFMAPYVVVTRKSDGKKGSLMFQHAPRLYFGWEEAT